MRLQKSLEGIYGCATTAQGFACPEIAAMGAMERLDVMLNDALYGILLEI